FIGLVTLGRISFGPLDDWGPAVRRVVAFRIDSIAYGFLLYVVINHATRNIVARISAFQAAAMLTVTAALAMCTIELIALGGSDWPKHLFPFAAAAFGSSCIIAALCASRWLERRPQITRLGIFAGQISYSVYLFHMIFLAAFPSIVNRLSL